MKNNEIVQSVREFLRKHRLLLVVLGFAALAVLPLLTQSNYLRGVFTKVLIYACIASGLNIINGYSGQSCLGIVGFLCIGAYTTGILATSYQLPFLLCMLSALIVSTVIGFIVSLPTLKLNGMFLSIITLGFAEMVRLIALNWQSLTNGPIGIKGLPHISLLNYQIISGRVSFYYLVLVMLILIVFLFHRLLNSRVGRAWISIREDQDAARSLGVEVPRYRSINFITGALVCGGMGCIMAYYYGYLHPDMFSLDEGFSVLSMCIVGGSGTLIGPIVGSFIINALTEGFRFSGEWRMVMYALLIIGMMWWRPQGLFGASDSVIAFSEGKRKRVRVKCANPKSTQLKGAE